MSPNIATAELGRSTLSATITPDTLPEAPTVLTPARENHTAKRPPAKPQSK